MTLVNTAPVLRYPASKSLYPVAEGRFVVWVPNNVSLTSVPRLKVPLDERPTSPSAFKDPVTVAELFTVTAIPAAVNVVAPLTVTAPGPIVTAPVEVLKVPEAALKSTAPVPDSAVRLRLAAI